MRVLVTGMILTGEPSWLFCRNLWGEKPASLSVAGMWLRNQDASTEKVNLFRKVCVTSRDSESRAVRRGAGGGGSFLCPRLPLLFPLVRIKEPLMGWGANLAFAVSVSEFPAASSGPSAERLVVPAEVCAGPGKSGPGVRLGLLLRRRQGPPPPRAQLLALSFFGFCFATDKKKKT